MRRIIKTAAVAGCVIVLAACAGTKVTTVVTAVPGALGSGDTANVEAFVEKRAAGVVQAPIQRKVTFGASAGSVQPASANLSAHPENKASSTFFAPQVDKDTTVTITAATSAASGATTVTVRPATGRGSFSNVAGDNVEILVSARKIGGLVRYDYTVKPGPNAGDLSFANVLFDVTVDGSTSVGVSPRSNIRLPGGRAQGRNFTITQTGATPSNSVIRGVFTFTAKSDARFGGTARWDIRDAAGNGLTIRTAGPK